MDIDKSGEIDYSGIIYSYINKFVKEFIATFLDNMIYKDEKYLKETFEKFDLVHIFKLLINK